VLPASFVAKYGTGVFQKNLIEKYSEPMQKKKSKVSRVGSNFDLTGKAVSKTTSSVGKTAMALGRAGAVLGAALAAFELIQGAFQLADEARRAKLYPLNFTLFDFDGVFEAIDYFMEFLIQEESCALLEIRNRNNLTTKLLTCFNPLLLQSDEVQQDAARSSHGHPLLGQCS